MKLRSSTHVLHTQPAASLSPSACVHAGYAPGRNVALPRAQGRHVRAAQGGRTQHHDRGLHVAGSLLRQRDADAGQAPEAAFAKRGLPSAPHAPRVRLAVHCLAQAPHTPVASGALMCLMHSLTSGCTVRSSFGCCAGAKRSTPQAVYTHGWSGFCVDNGTVSMWYAPSGRSAPADTVAPMKSAGAHAWRSEKSGKRRGMRRAAAQRVRPHTSSCSRPATAACHVAT